VGESEFEGYELCSVRKMVLEIFYSSRVVVETVDRFILIHMFEMVVIMNSMHLPFGRDC